MESRVFPVVPASQMPFVMMIVLVFFLLAMMVVFGWIMYWSKNTQVEYDGASLTITSGLWGQTLESGKLNIDEAKVIDLNQDTELKPRIRTNGIGLPGYKAGWFKLKNGNKALLFVTTKEQVVYLPTFEGYDLLLSVDRAEEFVNTLKK